MDYQDLGSHYKGCKIFERLQSGIDRLNKIHFHHECNDRLKYHFTGNNYYEVPSSGAKDVGDIVNLVTVYGCW